MSNDNLPEGMIAGFERRRLPGHQLEIDALVGGSGPPLLLLHGYPQTRVSWKAVAPKLSEKFTVVIPDLRGYGRSDKPEGEASHETYSKRTMALDQLATMRALGFDRFAVAGHDRGGRVAYRLSFDHPEAVTRVALLDVVPTAEMWANATAESAMGAYHWYFLAQPQPLAERLIGNDSEFYLKWTLQSWCGKNFIFDPQCVADYVACFKDKAAIHGACEDYRAGWTIDRQLDEADRGNRKIQAPVMVLWAKEYSVAKAKPVETWQEWADQVTGYEVPGGHFVNEEAPEEVARYLLEFFG